MGEGGVITIANDAMASVVPMLRHNGHTAFEHERKNYWIPAMGDLRFPQYNGGDLWPNNFCLGEIECALGAKLLDRIDEINQEKRTRALRFIDALGDFPVLQDQRTFVCKKMKRIHRDFICDQLF